MIELVPKAQRTAEGVRDAAARMTEVIDKETCVAYAATIITADGRTFTQKFSEGHRCQLLGSVTDLQYELMKCGDA